MCIDLYFYNKNVVVYKVTKPARAIDIYINMVIAMNYKNKQALYI